MLQYQLKAEDAPVLHLLDGIIVQGLKAGASDIHLEPGTERNRVRYRIDGVLQQAQRIPMERHTALISCVKLMAGMDIAEKRKPQDGRAQVSHSGQKIDLRISSLPTIQGEKIVIRVLDSGANQLRLEDMGFTGENLARYRTMYKASYGLVLITGPTGSGKTTTLYATLQELNQPERNLITVEDPVEYRMEKVLVIAPLRVGRDTWPEEIAKWDHLKDLTYSVAIGTQAERLAALRAKADIYIVNRENVPWLVEKSGMPFDYDLVIIDELSSFKNYTAKRFKSLMSVRSRVKRMVGLTGTPSSNGLMDLFAEFKVLDYGKRLGWYITHYRNRYFLPDKRSAQQVFTYKLKPGAEEQIYHAISDITISMTARDYLDMPKCIHNRVKVRLSERERALYDELKEQMVLSLGGEEIDAKNAASLTNKLLQMANGAVYDEEHAVHHIHDRKLDALEDLIEGANGIINVLSDIPKDIYTFREGQIERAIDALADDIIAGNDPYGNRYNFFVEKFVSDDLFRREHFTTSPFPPCAPGVISLSFKFDGSIVRCHNDSRVISSIDDSCEEMLEKHRMVWEDLIPRKCFSCPVVSICRNRCPMQPARI